MTFPVPTVAENTERQLRDISNALPGETIDTSADSDYRIRANAVSGVADGLYMHQGWIIRQIFPRIPPNLNTWSCTAGRATSFVKNRQRHQVRQ